MKRALKFIEDFLYVWSRIGKTYHIMLERLRLIRNFMWYIYKIFKHIYDHLLCWKTMIVHPNSLYWVAPTAAHIEELFIGRGVVLFSKVNKEKQSKRNCTLIYVVCIFRLGYHCPLQLCCTGLFHWALPAMYLPERMQFVWVPSNLELLYASGVYSGQQSLYRCVWE